MFDVVQVFGVMQVFGVVWVFGVVQVFGGSWLTQESNRCEVYLSLYLQFNKDDVKNVMLQSVSCGCIVVYTAASLHCWPYEAYKTIRAKMLIW